MNTDKYILQSDDTGEGLPLPLALSGYPAKDDAGSTIHYRRMKIAKCGEWTHRTAGYDVKIDPKRADGWIESFSGLSSSGVRPFLPSSHTPVFDAKGNNGYVVGMDRQGEDVFATVALHGDEALRTAAKNGRSIYVERNVKDAKGNAYPEAITHVCFTPSPILPELGGLLSLSATESTPAMTVPVLTLSSETKLKEVPVMKKELASQIREKVSTLKDVPEGEFVDKVGEVLLALSADLATTKDSLATVEKERDAKNSEVLALSANAPKSIDDWTLSLVTESVNTKRDAAIASGVISKAGADQLEKLFTVNDKLSPVALQLSAGSTKPLITRVWETLAANPGLKIEKATSRDPNYPSTVAMALSGEKPADEPMTEDRKKALLALAGV